MFIVIFVVFNKKIDKYYSRIYYAESM
jgi:hypothetical protein